MLGSYPQDLWIRLWDRRPVPYLTSKCGMEHLWPSSEQEKAAQWAAFRCLIEACLSVGVDRFAGAIDLLEDVVSSNVAAELLAISCEDSRRAVHLQLLAEGELPCDLRCCAVGRRRYRLPVHDVVVGRGPVFGAPDGGHLRGHGAVGPSSGPRQELDGDACGNQLGTS